MAPTTAAPALKTAQVNARIDAALKRAGDAALARAGLTPTQAVRAIWQLAADNADSPEVIIRAFDPGREEAERAVWEKERARRIELTRQGSTIVTEALAKAKGAEGSDPVSSAMMRETAELSWDELKELAFMENDPDSLL